jgi:membrane protein DedA with SNARE-associated domain
VLILALHVHLPHHLHGPTIDYVGVAIAAFLSWFGLPGPGEPVLIAASVVAAKHKLDISPVVLAAAAGALAGGILGWLAGMLAGRSLLTMPGPLRGMRLRAARRGEELFKRREVLAVLLTPAWVAGINRAGVVVYNVTNVVSAAGWAVGLGVGAYYLGPVVLDLGQDAGLIVSVVLVVVIVVSVGGEVVRRRRRRPEEYGRNSEGAGQRPREAEGSVSD